ncbi:MAG: protease HtpX [Gammaproteobacteria bacterium]|nr:protease HtpX [Gammaproteobacteria bacterium]
MRRIFYFLVTNIAVLAVLSVVWFILTSVFDIPEYYAGGLNLTYLLVLALVLGMGGSFISLALSKWSAKRMSGAKVIEKPTTETEMWLVGTVERIAKQAGIGTPEVAIYEGPVNAFATGMKKDKALVAVSTGLLDAMSRDEVEAVLGHEVAHIANGDMVTLTLIQGVLNTFVIFLSRIVGYFVDRVLLKNNRGMGIGYFASVIVAQIIFGILAAMVVAWFSRKREFRADAGSAQYTERDKMISALQRLKEGTHPKPLPDEMRAMGIVGGWRKGIGKLMMSHPPLDDRIAALRNPTMGGRGQRI